jgi:YVTN family beta-propeller protein
MTCRSESFLLKAIGITALILLMQAGIVSAGAVAYIGMSDSNVAIIDDAHPNNSFLTMIPSVAYSINGVAVSPDGTSVYVTNYSSNVYVINTSTYHISSVNLGPGVTASGIAVNPAGTKLYVPHYSLNPGGNNVSVYDIVHKTLLQPFTLGAACDGAIAFSPDGTMAYATDGGRGFSVINTTTNSVIATLDLGDDPGQIAVSPDGTVYVVSSSTSVSIINTTIPTQPQIIANVPVAADAKGIAVAPDGKKVYISTEYASQGTVTLINTTPPYGTSSVNVGGIPWGIAITPDGKDVYVENVGGNNVSIIDATVTPPKIKTTVNVGGLPQFFGKFIGPLMPPVANFTATPRGVYLFPPVTPFGLDFLIEGMQLTDQSTNSPTSWLWTLGDGPTTSTSTVQNPFCVPALNNHYPEITNHLFPVKLTVTNAVGSNTIQKTYWWGL